MSNYSLSELTPEFEHPLLNRWYSRGDIRKINGHYIFTIDEGDIEKPVIVLIHGFPTSSWDWQPIWAALRVNYRVLAIDMLGFGFSDKPKRRDYTIHKQADLVEKFIQEQGVSQYHTLSHDYGVSVAQEIMARQLDGNGQSLCLTCCFLNGGLFPETHQALLIQKLLLSSFGSTINKLLGFRQFAKSLSSVFGPETKPSRAELKAYWNVINFYNGKHMFSNLITYMNDRLAHRQRWVNALLKAKIPISLINGSFDPVSGKHLVARYRELNCRLDHLVELSNIGHYPHVEAPERVSSAYLSFLHSR